MDNEYLAKHPILGMVVSLGSGLFSFMDVLTPYLQFTTLCIGVLIGLLTLYSKFKQIKNGNNS